MSKTVEVCAVIMATSSVLIAGILGAICTILGEAL